MNKPSRIIAETLLLFTTAVWGSTFLIIKLLVTGVQVNSPFALLFARFALATVIAFIAFQPKRFPDRTELFGGLVIGVAAFGGYGLQTLGLQYTTPAKSGFITSLFILFVPFLSKIWERAKIPVRIYIALIPAAFGLWAISGAGKAIADINTGDKLTFFSALCFAFQVVGIQIYTRRGDWKWLTVLQFAIVTAASAISMPFENDCRLVWDIPNLVGIAYLGIFATVIALGMQMFVQRFTTSSRASLIYVSEPIFAALFAWLFIHDIMTVWEIIGGTAIVMSMVIGRFPSKAEKPGCHGFCGAR
ncbi:hypothetical protein DRQ36_00925 [bacterium]|nr:MAG: hypothetical protein DRQ36_00925 [bacterium]